MVRVMVLGQGRAATLFAWGLLRIKKGLMEPYGVPLAHLDLGVAIDDLEVVASVDVDSRKVGRTLYEIAKSYGLDPEPELKDVYVAPGLKLRSTPAFMKTNALDDGRDPSDAIARFEEYLDDVNPEVILDVTTTVSSQPLFDWEEVERLANKGLLPHSQVYAYSALKRGKLAYINLQPAYVACSPAFVEKAEQLSSLVLGDDGATGATPLTADLLEHLRERGRRVLSIAQFNIGGNTDFLALTEENRNKAKEETKSSIVKDILGYHTPHYIKPTGYLEPLGDKKFVSMHVQWITFGGYLDEMVVNMRINDSPALAGYMVDLARISKLLLDAGIHGTVYEVNAFYMKRPGPLGSRHLPKILAYTKLLEKLNKLRAVKLVRAAWKT